MSSRSKTLIPSPLPHLSSSKAKERAGKKGEICLIVTDIDGCLGEAEGVPFDLDVVRQIAGWNLRARSGAAVPAITLCSGRPAPYVDAALQVIGGFLPAVCENGAGLYSPQQYRFAWHPALPPDAVEILWRARKTLDAAVVQAGVGHFQPGKERALTLLAAPGHTLADLGCACEQALLDQGLPLEVQVSVTVVGIWLEGSDKGAGLEWLAMETGIPPLQMAGVGDAEGDLCFLRLCGFSAAPANAEDCVKANVDYVSHYEYGRGLLDIIEHILK
jgi:hydroxymethylpyrimidine pyrophosphatase-like HAD family hydrolase